MLAFYRYSRPYPSQRLVFEEELIPAAVQQIPVDRLSTPVVASALEVIVVSKSQEKREAVQQPDAPRAAKPSSALPPDYSVITGLSKTKLPGIAQRLAEVQERLSELKREESELKDLGATLLLKAKVKSVMVGDIRVTQTGGQSHTIKRDLLLKFGVSEKVIEKATVAGTPWTSLKVTVRKPGDDVEGEE